MSNETPLAQGPVDVNVRPPELPSDMSSDGREIWDWAAKLSEHTQLLHERRTLNAQILAARTQCGSCEDWMTRQCPREKHSNQTGRSTGPSSLTIKCVQFRMTRHTEKSVAKAQEKLAAIHARLERHNSGNERGR